LNKSRKKQKLSKKTIHEISAEIYQQAAQAQQAQQQAQAQQDAGNTQSNDDDTIDADFEKQ
jgi:molecular chaperone DnaK